MPVCASLGITGKDRIPAGHHFMQLGCGVSIHTHLWEGITLKVKFREDGERRAQGMENIVREPAKLIGF